MKISEAIGDVKDIALSAIKEKIISGIVADVFIFSYPPLSWILSFLIDKALSFMYKEGMLSLKYLEIDKEVSKENKAAVEAKEGLEKALSQGDPNEIAKAKDEFRKKYSDLIRFKP
jgi:hypothetical protein